MQGRQSYGGTKRDASIDARFSAPDGVERARILGNSTRTHTSINAAQLKFAHKFA